MSNSRGNEPSSPTRSGPPPLRQPAERPTGAKKRSSNMAKLRAFIKRPTIGTLRSELSTVLQAGLFGFILIFLFGALYSFGGANDRRHKDDEEERKTDPVASAFGVKLTAKDWDARAARVRLNEPSAAATRHNQLGTMLTDWIRNQSELRLASLRGVKVSRAEVIKDIDKQIKEALKQQRGAMTPKQWRFKLSKEGSSEEAKAAEMRSKVLADPEAYQELETKLIKDKLRKKIGTEIKITDDDLKKEYNEISGHVILVQVPAVKPTAPKDTDKTPETADAKKARESGEAAWRKAMDAKKADAEKLLKEVQADPTKFVDIAKAKSDDFATKKDGGKVTALTLERSTYGDGFKPAFDVKKGELSGLLEGNQGWLIFQCDEKKVWPDDFKKADPRDFEAAKKIADDLAAQLAKGADFAKLATDKSDDPGSGKKGGDLGEVSRHQMVKPFEKMVFALAKDEISKPFRTQFGWHIAQVTERTEPKGDEVVPADDEDETPDPEDKAKVEEAKAVKEVQALLPQHKDLPKAKSVKARHILVKAEDSQKKLDDKRTQLEDRRKSELYEKLVEETRKKGLERGDIVVFDPQLKSFMAQRDGKQDQELVELRNAAALWPTSHADVHYELGQLYDRQGGFALGNEVQVAAIKALGKDPQAAKGLVEALDNGMPDVVKAACNALGELKAKEATAKLTDLAKSSQDDLIAQAAAAALKQMGVEAPVREKKPASASLTPAAPQGMKLEMPPKP